MKDIIITISREYGCGAREVGEKLAKRLGIPYYDKHLVEMAAQRSGLTPEFIEKTEQRNTGGVFYGGTAMNSMGGVMNGGTSLADQVYLAQFGTIREIAAKGSCVIVGRCADAILKDDYKCLNIFLHADMEKRVERAVKVYGVDPDKAERVVRDTDKARAKHYKYYSDRKWGEADNYDITMNISSFSIDGAVDILADSIRAMKK
ncbi:MAG: AAA family ATPase [Candidatus Heteroscillospira sp.]|jgi:cytidylate kinase